MASPLTSLTDEYRDEPSARPLSRVPQHTDVDNDRDRIVGDSDALRYVMFRVDQVASTAATVLLLGETGTGKELVARAIHKRSPRRNRPFARRELRDACRRVLIESELFGRERGAFTGAHATQAGRFELANRGTIFLDEIGELPLELQPKLLRVLQEGQFERLGSPRTVDVDVRVIAATNRDLAEEVRQGRFRRDLYYRLNVFPITLPALRRAPRRHPSVGSSRRRSAIASTGEADRRHSAACRSTCCRATTGRATSANSRTCCSAPSSCRPDSTLALQGAWMPTSEPSFEPAGGATLAEVERRHIHSVLESTHWRLEGAGGAAAILGLKPSTLRSRMAKQNIVRPR